MTAGLFAPDQRKLTFSTMSVIAGAAYNNLSVSAALPAIGDDLGNLAWLPVVVTVELIAAAIAVLAIGPVIDAVGTRATYRVVLVAFAVSSVLCALAPTMAVLIVSRGLQGLASGAIIANVMAAIGLGVPERLRAKAYAANSSVWGVMGLAGPAIAAGLITLFGWPAIFLVNVPVALFAGIVGWNAFPGPTDEPGSLRPDRPGLALMASFALVSLGAVSTIAWWTPLLFVVAVGLLALYVRYERTVPSPVLRMRHITGDRFRWLHVSAMLVLTGGVAANAFLPVYAKGVRAYSTGEAAFTVVYMTVGWTAGAFLSSRLSDRHRNETVVFGGSSVLAVATVLIAVGVALDIAMWALFCLYFLTGVGLGGVASAGVTALQARAGPAEMGRVNAAHQFVRTLGFSYGAAIGGASLFTVVAWELGDADAVRALLEDTDVSFSAEQVDGLRLGYLWSMIVAGVISAVATLAAAKLYRNAAARARLERQPALDTR